MNIGTKHRIVNTFKDILFLDSAGAASTVKADITTVVIPGFATLKKDSYVKGSFLKVPASAGVKEVSELTVAGSASAAGRNSVSLSIEVRSSRLESEYSRYSQFFGKLLAFGAEVAASATAAQIVTALKAAIDARVARYGDLPFTVAANAAKLVITLKEDHLQLGDVSLKVSDKSGLVDAVSVSKAVTTVAVPAAGKGSQVEENISFLTGTNALAGGWLADERVQLDATYDEYQLSIAFTDAIVPMPVALGAKTGSAGQIDLALFVSSGAEADKKTLFESLFEAGVWEAEG